MGFQVPFATISSDFKANALQVACDIKKENIPKLISLMFCLPSLQTQVPFDTYFNVSQLESCHRVIVMDEFMKTVAPIVWPESKRICRYFILTWEIQ